VKQAWAAGKSRSLGGFLYRFYTLDDGLRERSDVMRFLYQDHPQCILRWMKWNRLIPTERDHDLLKELGGSFIHRKIILG
jgi:hypothetical protein